MATYPEGSGQTTATNHYGGSATHTYGQATTASNCYGGTAYHVTASGYSTDTNFSGATGAVRIPTAYPVPPVSSPFAIGGIYAVLPASFISPCFAGSTY
jgi:hypothetical protein